LHTPSITQLQNQKLLSAPLSDYSIEYSRSDGYEAEITEIDNGSINITINAVDGNPVDVDSIIIHVVKIGRRGLLIAGIETEPNPNAAREKISSDDKPSSKMNSPESSYGHSLFMQDRCNKNTDHCVPASGSRHYCDGVCDSGCDCKAGCVCSMPIGSSKGQCVPGKSDPNRACCFRASQCRDGCNCVKPIGRDKGTCVTPDLRC